MIQNIYFFNLLILVAIKYMMKKFYDSCRKQICLILHVVNSTGTCVKKIYYT